MQIHRFTSTYLTLSLLASALAACGDNNATTTEGSTSGSSTDETTTGKPTTMTATPAPS